jgi:hypothetical protein
LTDRVIDQTQFRMGMNHEDNFALSRVVASFGRHRRSTLPSFRAERGISLCVQTDCGRKNQSEIPRSARNDSVG